MCGIAGIVNYPKEEILQKLKAALFHRGPDEQNIFTEGHIGFVHTRLAIQDIKHGQQPLHLGNCTIVFNGQIYNHFALRKQYLQEFNLSTQSDTETLLALYLRFGTNLFQYLDGMFAFAILDRNKNQLILARDRAGKKPLYYYQKEDIFAFASELNAIKSILPLSIKHEAIQSLLHSGFLFKEHTAYQEVRKLNAGEYLILDLSTLTVQHQRYFDILEYYQQPKLDISLSDAVTRIDTSLQSAVRARLLSSELEVGAFLSGGIDSSLIVAMAAKEQSKIKTFTIKFAGGYDESHLARLTAKRYGTEHREIEIAMNIEQDLEKILLNYGEPFLDSSAIPSYYVAKEAKKYVTVVLNGDGADELFAGYRRYVPVANNWITYANKLSWLSRVLPKPHNKQSKYNYLYRLLTMARKRGLDFYSSATIDSFSDYYPFIDNQIDQQADSYIRSILEQKTLSPLSKMLYLDFNILLFSDLLVKMDIATMAHALEARSPFLSKEMLMLAPSLPDSYKIHGTSTKHVLRQLSKKYLPDEIIHQPKRGFEVPLKSWLDHELKDKMYHYLKGSPKVGDYIDTLFIQKLLDKKINVSDEKRAKMLWSLLATEIWLQDA